MIADGLAQLSKLWWWCGACQLASCTHGASRGVCLGERRQHPFRFVDSQVRVSAGKRIEASVQQDLAAVAAVNKMKANGPTHNNLKEWVNPGGISMHFCGLAKNKLLQPWCFGCEIGGGSTSRLQQSTQPYVYATVCVPFSNIATVGNCSVGLES